jgi:ABC-type multidrug transport system ATPase subunit
MAHVPQNDHLLPYLTVRETLRFAADLKTRGTPSEKEAIVNQVLDELGLTMCADTVIGNRQAFCLLIS